ncbi:MAG: hypothetical protein GC138_07745 [Gammaproteobacteria bacterium]|nr:hypothetical protein [Gammaproteobacteria bacterium]
MLLDRIECRLDPRIKTEVEISYYIPTMQGHHEIRKGTLTELGEGGARLLLDQPHRVDARLFVTGIYDAQDPVECDVRWIRKASSSNSYIVGVAFSD